MKKSVFKKKKHIPLSLVPKVRKRHVLPIFKDHETAWKLFAEGALRNKVFHDDVMNRGKKCLACNRCFNHEDAAVSSRIEKHHQCYLRLCIGQILPEDSEDIYRLVKNGEFPHVPDCRQCKTENPEYYEGCIKKIFPVHSQCHEDIHEVERHLFIKLSEKLRDAFRIVTSKVINFHEN
ncbi:MAG: hypothetical protein KDE66_11620 [Nitrosomonas sp.]|nr:hypothetical protein [Nitrosomonas sp.]MCP5250401.1 hypothetical protein [Burkholderiales bacterium]